MFMNINIVKFLTASLLLALSTTSCLQLTEDQDSAYGYLSFTSVDVDLTVNQLVQTRSMDLPEIQAPELSELSYKIVDAAGNVCYDNVGLWSDASLTLPVGTGYKFIAYYGTDGIGNTPYFYGEQTFDIASLTSTELKPLTVSVLNSLINVTIDESLGNYLKNVKLSLISGSAVCENVTLGTWYFVPSQADLNVELKGTNDADVPVNKVYTLDSPASATAYEVICGLDTTNWPKISLTINENDAWASRIYITSPASFTGAVSDKNKEAVVYEAILSSSSDWTNPSIATKENDVLVFKGLAPGNEYQLRARVGALISNVVKVKPMVDGLSVSANHSFTSNELDGTDVISEFSKSEIVKSSITDWTIDICKADGTALRSGLGLGTSDGSLIEQVDGWPYLPCGTGEKYKLKASCKMDGETYHFTDLEILGLTVPEISLSLSAYTSYDKYKGTNGITKNVTDANKSDASTLYNAGAKWGVSKNLMKNTNYQKVFVIKIDDDASRSYTVKGYDNNEVYENISNLGWSAHTLQVSFTFDNKTVIKKQTHHITGLPYKKDFTTDTDTSGWTFVERTEYNKGYSKDYKSGCGYPLYYAYTNDNGCHLFSPTYYMPESVSVTYHADFCAGNTGYTSKSYNIYGGVTTGTTVKQDLKISIQEKNACLTDGFNFATLSTTTQISNNNRLCFSHNADLAWGQAVKHYIYMASLMIEYAQN